MEIPPVHSLKVPVRVRRQVQPLHGTNENLHNPKTPIPSQVLQQLQNPEPARSCLLQELRNQTLTTHNFKQQMSEEPERQAHKPFGRDQRISSDHP